MEESRSTMESWSPSHGIQAIFFKVLNKDLGLPPVKMLRYFIFAAGKQLLPKGSKDTSNMETMMRGFINDAPFSPLEVKIKSKMMAQPRQTM